ncbi:fluoride efflux transporter CrcB [Paracoccus jiaweipingae]|uniref:fluoride efflux transporter CrcB n=1 Tax=unclassified Paracoccus (in: a-proteobacteria) TaxID=2688777 RepID=UPI0037A5856A
MQPYAYLQVALGGAIGATARFAVYRLIGLTGFPLATVVVNVLGSFVMGLLVAVLAARGGNALAPLLMTGILGGFTTFSTFSLDALSLWQRGDHGAAMVYVCVSVMLSLAAVVAGLSLGRGIIA